DVRVQGEFLQRDGLAEEGGQRPYQEGRAGQAREEGSAHRRPGARLHQAVGLLLEGADLPAAAGPTREDAAARILRSAVREDRAGPHAHAPGISRPGCADDGEGPEEAAALSLPAAL